MEFGIFLNGYIPGPAAHDTLAEHTALDAGDRVHDPRRPAQLEVRLVRRAPLASPSTATCRRSEVVIGYCAARDRAHPPRRRPSSACRRARSTRSASPSGPPCSTTSPTTATSSVPAAARAATRWPRSTSSTPTRPRPSGTRSIREIPRMWEQRDYDVPGRALHRARPAQHPAQAVRQGAPADLGGVRQPAHVRQGRLARHRRDRLQLRADPQPEGPGRGVQGGDREPAPSRSASSRTTT